MDAFPIIIFGFVVLAIFIRVVAGSMDSSRVRAYIEERGGRLISSIWEPFGKGWFGEKNDRIYRVRYVDHAGSEHEASCKTSLFSGVYFTQDCIVHYAKRPIDEPPEKPSRLAELEAENDRLREEIKRINKRNG